MSILSWAGEQGAPCAPARRPLARPRRPLASDRHPHTPISRALVYHGHGGVPGAAPVTGRRRRSRDEGRRMSAKNLNRSSSLSRSASCVGGMGPPVSRDQGALQGVGGRHLQGALSPTPPHPGASGHHTCLKKLVTVSVAGRKPEKLQVSSALLARSWGPRRRRSVQAGRRSEWGEVGRWTGSADREPRGLGAVSRPAGRGRRCPAAPPRPLGPAPPPHHPRCPSHGPAAPRCSRCWPGARPSRRRACGSGPGACRTARLPGAASPASPCSERGRPPGS